MTRPTKLIPPKVIPIRKSSGPEEGERVRASAPDPGRRKRSRRRRPDREGARVDISRVEYGHLRLHGQGVEGSVERRSML